MIKVLITGGCGFIGSSVVNELLSRNLDVYAIDNLSLGKDHWKDAASKPKLFVNDILDIDACTDIFGKVLPEVVIHLAAHHYIPFCEKNAFDAFNLNVKGTLNILECARRTNVKKFFFASTGDIYPPSFSPNREVDTVSPVYVYGHSKYLGEQICIRYHETQMQASAFIIGRLFNAAGPRETNPHLLPEVVKQVVAGKRTIEVGNLWPLRDYVDVATMASVIVDLTLNAQGIDIVNIGSGQVQGVGDALETLLSVLPFKVSITSVKERQRPNDRPFLCPDVSKLRRMLGRTADPFSRTTAAAIFQEYPNCARS